MSIITPNIMLDDDELLRSISVLRDEVKYGIKLVIERILSDARVKGNTSELVTISQECELDLDIEDNLDPCNGIQIVTAWIFDFNKAYTHSAYPTPKVKVTFCNRYGLITINNLADYNPDTDSFRIEVLDFM